MKYEYGVEYEVNGEDPSLDDDIIVEQYSTADDKWHKGRAGTWNWRARSIVKFRIVDERYKPVEKDNTWFERGERPPVGAVCEYLSKSGRCWVKCEIVFVSEYVVVIQGEAHLNELAQVAFNVGDFPDFRPIRTEREKAIEAAKAALLKKGSLAIITNLETLYDAGLLRLPEGE